MLLKTIHKTMQITHVKDGKGTFYRAVGSSEKLGSDISSSEKLSGGGGPCTLRVIWMKSTKKLGEGNGSPCSLVSYIPVFL